MRGVLDRKGEQFAYLQGNILFTLDGEATGKIQGDFVLDMAGKQTWRIVGDGLYSLDGSETIGYFSGERPSDYDL
jgi:hypothetical protein